MAFKNLFCGTQWKLQFINCNFRCMGIDRCINYRNNRMMHEVKFQTSYIHKIEKDQLIQLTIAVQQDESNGGHKKILIRRSLQGSVSSLIDKINNESFKIGEKIRKKFKDIDYLSRQPDALLLCNGEPVDTDKACSTIFTLNGDLVLRLFGNYHVCLINVPMITAVKLPETPISNVYIYPILIETYYTEKCDVRWFKSLQVSPKDETWIEVGNNIHYLVQENDIDYYLKFECVPKKGDSVGLPWEQIIQNKVQPNQCSYFYHNIHELTKEEAQNGMFRLVSYNVLADYYATTKEGQKMFSYCPSFAINKNQRFSAILNELIGYNSDLICLQEVEKDVFASLWSPILQKQGYNGFLCLKLLGLEGTACFYKNKNFNIVSFENYNYGAEILENPNLRNILLYVQKNNELFKKIVSLKHCLQLLAFKSKVKTNEILIVGNVHLYSYPDAKLIRTLQVLAIFGLLKSMLQKIKPGLSNSNVSIILCGDFNSVPSSPIHSYIKNSILSETFQDDKMMGNYDSIIFGHPLKMESAYEGLLFTNYTQDFQGCLDYIYYESDRLEVDKIYPVANEDKLSAHTGIPSVSFPSDHIPLIVDFKWKC